MASRGRNIARKLLAAAWIAAAAHAAGPAHAAKLDVTPSVLLEQGYDSNVFNTRDNEKEDFFLRTAPSLTFSWRTQDNGVLTLLTGLTADSYYKYTEQNRKTTAINIGLETRQPMKLSPSFSIAPAGHFVLSQDSYHRAFLVPSGNPLVPQSIGSETGTRKSRDYGAGLRMFYQVSGADELSVGGGFNKRDYLDAVPGVFDSRVFFGDAAWKHQVTARASLGLYANTSYNTWDNSTSSRVYAGGVTGGYQFTPTVTLDARAGVSRAEEKLGTGIPDEAKMSPNAFLSLTYFLSEDSRATLAALFEQAGGGAFNRTTRRGNVLLSFTKQFASRWWADLSGNYQVNRSLDGGVTVDMQSVAGTAGIRYLPRDWATIHLSGSAFRQQSSGLEGTDLKRYSAFFGFTLGPTYNIY